MLCSLRDPGNVGTVIRSAAAFGFDGIILSEGCADVYNRKTIRAAMGNLFRIKTYVTADAGETVEFLKRQGRRVLCAELRPSSVSMNDIDFKSTDVVIVGNEGHGIPEKVSASADMSFFIPISSNVESLNAAVAASVIAFSQSRA
jgi:TrmH family RNA methyltransferase